MTRRSGRWHAAAATAVIWASGWAGTCAAADPLPAAVSQALDQAHLAHRSLVALVQEVGNGRTELAWQPDQPVNPASLMKLVTTYASLDLLGPAWSWATPVWLQGSIHDGILDGNLVIQGSGDPKLVVERVWLLLARVRQWGVNEIHGDIVLDRSAFETPAQGAGDFDGESQRPYNVNADALLINYKSVVFTITADPAQGVAHIAADVPLAGVTSDASVPLLPGPCEEWRSALRADFSDPEQFRFKGAFAQACQERVWAVAYADPSSYNARALRGIWQALGGRLSGGVREGAAPAGRPQFEVASAPLADVVHDINKYSNNVMAQQLFLTLGRTQRGTGTTDNARQVLRQWALDRFGPQASAGLVIDNGSGLSRTARLSAQLLARLLQAAWAGPWMSELMSSLPVSGIDGTLKHARAGIGRAHLKTGSLRDVSGVAGYVRAESGRRYVVVGVVNDQNADAARPALEALVQWAANDTGRAAAHPRPDARTETP